MRNMRKNQHPEIRAEGISDRDTYAVRAQRRRRQGLFAESRRRAATGPVNEEPIWKYFSEFSQESMIFILNKNIRTPINNVNYIIILHHYI